MVATTTTEMKEIAETAETAEKSTEGSNESKPTNGNGSRKARRTKKKVVKQPEPQPEPPELDEFQIMEVEDGILGEDFAPHEMDEESKSYFVGPLMSSPEWPEFVMSQFVEGELDEEGNPYIHGLRRVARLLLGKTETSGCQMEQCPQVLENGGQQIAVATYHITIDVIRESQGKVGVIEVGDVSLANSREFSKFAARTAATQAEARCLRKLLMLPRNTIAAEERDDDSITLGPVTEQILNVIDLLCERTDVNVEKLFALGGFADYRKIPKQRALGMIEYLDDVLRGEKTAKPGIVGYEKEWR